MHNSKEADIMFSIIKVFGHQTATKFCTQPGYGMDQVM